jgi:hypothetical protein
MLTQLGCPLVTHSIHSLDLFLSASDSRLQLIEWLIAAIYPGYSLDPDYRSCRDPDPHILKLKQLTGVLWQLGVMPFSKFTRNLDYLNYVEGVLGNENAVNLLFDLTELAESKFLGNANQIERVANDLLGELIRCNQELVNQSYDPYGVTFPAKFIETTEDDDNSKKVNELYTAMLQ